MPCSCETPEPQIEIERGTKVHHTRIAFGTRINGNCPSWVQYISDHWVVVRYYNASKGTFISEKVIPRSEFNEDFEVCPDQYPEPLGIEF